MADLFDVSGKTVMITGGLGLLGTAYTRELARRGACVAILDVVPADRAEQMVRSSFDDIERERIHYYHADITSPSELADVRSEFGMRHSGLDVLINNAALNPRVEDGVAAARVGSSFENLPLSEWQESFDVDVTGTMLCSQTFLSLMSDSASIINIASMYAIAGPDQRLYEEGFTKPISYSATKGAVVSMTRYLAAYLANRGIRVNCVVLGGVENNQSPEFQRRYAERTPLGRMATPDECTGIIVYLCSAASSYATGSLFVVDGGYLCW